MDTLDSEMKDWGGKLNSFINFAAGACFGTLSSILIGLDIDNRISGTMSAGVLESAANFFLLFVFLMIFKKKLVSLVVNL